MRFGISLISWMLPKILRIRRAAVVRPDLLFAGASIALVAMSFPALCGNAAKGAPQWIPATAGSCRGALVPLPLSNASDPCAGRALSRRGREKLRAHVTVRRSRLFVGFARYSH